MSKRIATKPLIAATGMSDYSRVQVDDDSDFREDSVLPLADDSVQKDKEQHNSTISVVAPMDLPAGYQFSVKMKDESTALVEVPYNVTEGRTFSALIVANKNVSRRNCNIDIDSNGFAENDDDNDDDKYRPASIGEWRDTTCDMMKLGFIATCCFPLALGQILTRHNLNACGRPRRQAQGTGWSAFKILLIVNVSYFFVNFVPALLSVLSLGYVDRYVDIDFLKSEEMADFSFKVLVLSNLMKWSCLIYLVNLTIVTRVYLRRTHRIPSECCNNSCCCYSYCYNCTCEDVLCALCCRSCAVIQMSRHTIDLTTQQHTVCTETGVKNRTQSSGCPVIV